MEEGIFPKNAFHGGTNVIGKIYSGIVLHVGTTDQNIPMREGVSQNEFSSNMNIVN